uniref:Uncharacterized protein n=1 Tax=Nymphaea colorata TaxID=210225 RepID=A0A5K1D7V4_9MAGN
MLANAEASLAKVSRGGKETELRKKPSKGSRIAMEKGSYCGPKMDEIRTIVARWYLFFLKRERKEEDG